MLPMTLARGVLAALARLEQVSTTLAFVVMVGVLGWDILGRELLGSGKIWATPIAVYANVLVAFIGMGVASAGGAHLRPKFFDKAVPSAWNGAFDRFTDVGFALFCAGAAGLCWRMLQESVKLEETDPVLQWQIWPLQTILVAAFGIAVIRHSIYAIWPPLRPLPSGGENAPPTDEQVNAFVSEAVTASPLHKVGVASPSSASSSSPSSPASSASKPHPGPRP